jgi:hypothetical protein
LIALGFAKNGGGGMQKNWTHNDQAKAGCCYPSFIDTFCAVPFKANWYLSDARLLDRNTRLGFRFYGAVRVKNRDLPLARYPAALPSASTLPFLRYIVAIPISAADSRRFISFEYPLAAIWSGFLMTFAHPSNMVSSNHRL